MVLNELKECTRDVDIDFAIKSIKAVGIISLNFDKFVDKSICGIRRDPNHHK